MIWIIAAVVVLGVAYSFLVISGETVYRVTYHDPGGRVWTMHVSASNEREALLTIRRAIAEEVQIVEVREEL